MDQDTRWLIKYKEVMIFVEINHRNPSRHWLEEHDMLNRLKANRNKMNAGEMKEERLVMFKKLRGLMERYKRKNPYQ